MAGDALIVFFEVVVCLVLAITVLWSFAKLLGYIASVFEGEPLRQTFRDDIASTRRELRLIRRRPARPERSHAPGGGHLPTAG